MEKSMSVKIAALLALAAGILFYQAVAAEVIPRSPVLVELFTSEGCSSCPPADALLASLDAANDPENPQVIVLSEHVDYWNSIGWKDPYSSATFSERQKAYAQRFNLNSVYTPQMVVNGAAEFVGNDRQVAKAKITAAGARRAAVPVGLFAAGPGIVRVDIGKVTPGTISGSADVMVAVASNEISTQVTGGENGGRKLHHVAVVRTMKRVGELRDGQYFSKEIDPGKTSSGLRIVAWVQERGQGRVLGAAMRPMAAISGPVTSELPVPK
jgi:hypothetical protein